LEQIGITFAFSKANSAGSYVRGWASVVSQDGKPIEDWQGDVIDIDDLRRAAHDFISDVRVGKAMHGGSQIGEVVESLIIDDDIAKALGMADSRRGWFVGMRVNDETVQKRIRDGELKQFSIGGVGRRVEIENHA
jgi:hypothetical protein